MPPTTGIERELGGVHQDLEWIKRELIRQDEVQTARHEERTKALQAQSLRIDALEQTVARYKGALAILSAVATAGGMIGAAATYLARKIGV